MRTNITPRSVTTRLLVLVLAAELGAFSCVLAQSDASPRARERANERSRLNRDRAMSDEQFIRQAYERGLFELKLAHAAVEATKDKQVETMAHRIINEQARANGELKKLADAKNITLPKDLSERDQERVAQLARLQGEEFDRAYRDNLNTDYKRTIQMFQDAARDARDPQVRDVASRYASLFEQHASVIGISGLGTSDRGLVRERETTSSGALATTDEQALKRLSRISRTQVEAARVAVKNARDNEVQRLAQRVVQDHRQMNQELRDLAAKKNISLPREVAEAQETIVESLSKSSGTQFDKDYRQYMVASHRNAIELLQQTARANDPDIRAFAERHLNSMQERLRMVQRLAQDE